MLNLNLICKLLNRKLLIDFISGSIKEKNTVYDVINFKTFKYSYHGLTVRIFSVYLKCCGIQTLRIGFSSYLIISINKFSGYMYGRQRA